MNGYSRNRSCSCARCRCTGYLGPIVLITLGVLFLIDQYTMYSFSSTWPALLIVVGIVKLLQWNAPTTGHVEASDVSTGNTNAGATSGSGKEAPTDGSQVTHG